MATSVNPDGPPVPATDISDVQFRTYSDESELPRIMAVVDGELSEPYSIFTYRYFIHQWPDLCCTANVGDTCVGTIVCKIDEHKSGALRGYIAMLVVVKPMRGRGIASELVSRCIQVMQVSGCEEVTLEAEVTNLGALALYGNLGFVRAKRLHRYYLNGVDAFRLKLRFPKPQTEIDLEGLSSNASQEGRDVGGGPSLRISNVRQHSHSHAHSHEHHHHHDGCSHDHSNSHHGKLYHEHQQQQQQQHQHHHHEHGPNCRH